MTMTSSERIPASEPKQWVVWEIMKRNDEKQNEKEKKKEKNEEKEKEEEEEAE